MGRSHSYIRVSMLVGDVQGLILYLPILRLCMPRTKTNPFVLLFRLRDRLHPISISFPPPWGCQSFTVWPTLSVPVGQAGIRCQTQCSYASCVRRHCLSRHTGDPNALLVIGICVNHVLTDLVLSRSASLCDYPGHSLNRCRLNKERIL